MRKTQLAEILKKPAFILTLILFSFFVKELFLAALFPMFTGQDESRHYNTIQFLAEPKEKTWEIIENGEEIDARKDRHYLETYNFSEEIRETSRAAQTSSFRQENYKKQVFSDGYMGESEEKINEHGWKNYIVNYPPDTAGSGFRVYHWLAAQIEKIFNQEDILVRSFLSRIFSVMLGTITIFLAYFIAKQIGFSSKNSLLMTAIISFQPKFSMYITNINCDSLLILSFALFTLGGILSLRDGLNWKNTLILIGSVILGLLTKGTAIVLLGVFIFLVFFHIYKMSADRKKFFRISAVSLLLLTLLVFVFFQKYNIKTVLPFKKEVSFSTVIVSLYDYLSDSLPKVDSAAKNYWGDLNWTNDNSTGYFIKLIWAGEALALAGLAMFFISKSKPEFLPEKKYVLFLLGMLIALQLGIRFHDWQIFNKTGELTLGTPGRYFIPNIISHIILVFVGLGMILKREKYLHTSLIIGLLLMFSFSMYVILGIILPRYYL